MKFYGNDIATLGHRRLRPGFIDHCLPFGFASYGSAGEVRAVVVERL